MTRTNHFIRNSLCCAFLGVLCWALSGQEESRSFRVLGYGDHFFEGIYFVVETDLGEEQQVVDFKPNQKSRRYAVPDRVSEISFRREVDQGDGDPIEIEVAAVRFADGQQRALFVFFETSDFAASQQYEVLELDESPDVWSAGCFRFLNLSGSELNCRMGSRELALPLDASEIIRFDPDSQGVMPFRLSVIWMGVERTVLSMRMAPDPNHPKLFVIKPPVEEGSLRVRLDTLW